MFKSIKKSLKYLTILIGIIILVPTFFYLIAQIPQVQTFIVKRITDHLSDQIKSTITIGSIDYSFFNKLRINDLLIKDYNNDTLAYSKKISAGFRRLDFRNKVIRLGQVELENPSVALITDTSGIMNLTWLINLLGSSEKTGEKSKSILSVNKLTIKDGRFLMFNKKDSGSKMPIDFSNLNLSEIYGDIDDIRIQNDSTVFRINDLEFSESKGFLVRSMTSRIQIAEHDFKFSNLFLYLDSSIINASHIDIVADSSGSFRRFTDDVRLNFDLQKSLISFSDLRYFVPSLKGSDESVELSGKISGTISELKGRNIFLSFGNKSNIHCDFDLSGLPRIEDTFIHVGVNSLNTNANDVGSIRIPGRQKIVVPEFLYKLGDISFNGSFTGFATDFVTYGNFGTALGNLRTDISLRPEGDKRFKVKGLVNGTNIDLGELTAKKDLLGKISMETNVDGYASSSKKISGNLTGKIDSVEINGYVYRNVALNGIFTEKTWDGNIKIADKNIKMDLLGMFDFSSDLPEFDFTLNLAESNLYKLNIVKTDTSSRLSMLLTANFRGNNIDNLLGEIKMINSTLWKYENKIELYDFSLKAFNENNKPAISLRTDFVDADLRGYYNFGGIGSVLKSALASLIPSRFTPPVIGKNQIKNNFTFTLNFKNTDKINKFFRTGLLLSDKSTLNGIFNPDSTIKIIVIAKTLNYRNNIFNNLSVNAGYSGTSFSTDLRSTSLSILGQSRLMDFKAGINAKPDNFIFNMDWDDKEEVPNKGAFVARGSFIRKEAGEKGFLLKIDIDSADVSTRKNLWKIKQSSVLVDSNAIDIDRFALSSKGHSYSIDGTISKRAEDTLKLEFKGIDISPLGQLEQKNDKSEESGVPFNPKGIINGNILVSNVLTSPMIESNIRVNGFSLLGGDYGDLSVVSEWNAASKVADISARNNLKGARNIDVKGYYDPSTKYINLNATAAHLPVDALNPLLSFFASGITGTVSGKVRFSGKPGELVLNGSLLAENTSMKIDYLQTKYKINDTIRFDKTGIKFKNVKVTDERGNYATLSGSINHKYFKDYAVDLIVNMDKNDCLVLNTQQKDNELFYGTAFATGVTTIKSGPNILSFDISAKTGKGTRVYIPLSSAMSVSEHSFVTFVNPDTARKENDIKQQVVKVQPSQSKLEITFDLDVTPEAEVQLLIDPKAGDVIKGRGSGKLNISLNKEGQFKIYGDYIIDQGEYLFTLQNLVNKRFDVVSGGKVTFIGDVENAEINLTANYKNLRTSLYPILPFEKYNARIPVEPQLNLSGKLFNPVVGLNINLPNADEETRAYLKNAITTEEELSRQFLYLLVMNSFYSDPSFRSSPGPAVSGTSAMAVTTTEMLSNQVSNWLSQISNDFDVGFNYRPGTKDINSQELQVALSTQLLNDKVTINGNFDVRGANNPEGNPLTGDFDIEYKITEKIRFKVFNRYNNPYTGRGAPYTQGLGVFFKQDFNKFSDLLKKKNKSDMKKEDEITTK